MTRKNRDVLATGTAADEAAADDSRVNDAPASAGPPNDAAMAADCTDGQCAEALVELESYLDGQLPESRLADIREHLVACYPCTSRASFEEQLRAIVRRDCVDHAPPSLLARIEATLDVAEDSADEVAGR